MASNIVPAKYQKAVSTAFYVVVTLVGLTFIVTNTFGILAAVQIISFPANFTAPKCLMLFGLSVTFMCVLLWFGMVLDIFRPYEEFRKLVLRGLIAGILGAILVALRGVF